MSASMESGTLDVNYVIDANHGIVTAEILGTTAAGASRCTAPDKFDPEIGQALALARALKTLAREIERAARREVDYRDHLRDKQEEATARSLRRRKARGVDRQVQHLSNAMKYATENYDHSDDDYLKLVLDKLGQENVAS